MGDYKDLEIPLLEMAINDLAWRSLNPAPSYYENEEPTTAQAILVLSETIRQASLAFVAAYLDVANEQRKLAEEDE